MEENSFSLYETEKPTNESFTVTFTPGTDVKEYTIILYKDGKENQKKIIETNQKTDIFIFETGTYSIEVNINKNNDEKETIKSGTYIIDKEAPIIEADKNVITIKQGQSFNPLDYIKVTDNIDKNVEIKTTYETINLDQIGTQTITYEAYDSSGNKETKILIVNIKKNNDNILMVYQGLIGIFLIFIAFITIWYQRKKRKFIRVSKYSVQGIKTEQTSIMDYFINTYMKMLKFMVQILNSSTLIKKYGQKYNKYVPLCNLKIRNGITLIAHKIYFAILFTIICAFSKALLKDVISIEEGMLLFVIGYFLLDIKYIILYKKYHEKLEDDLLESVIVMNNAFKVGASPEQAIRIVSEEMTGTIGKEYKQIYSEIKFGLSINDAFKRFSERLNLEEAEYIAASLEILNKTGGDVVKIFDSIEKNLFNKRKIKNEYKALTGSPKLISNFLFILPFVFVILILMINKDYFNPLFTKPIGIFLVLIALTLYILYVIIIKKIFKTRM